MSFLVGRLAFIRKYFVIKTTSTINKDTKLENNTSLFTGQITVEITTEPTAYKYSACNSFPKLVKISYPINVHLLSSLRAQ